MGYFNPKKNRPFLGVDEETESTPIAPFTLKVKANAASVRLLPSGEELPFTHEGEYVLFKTRTTKIFDMYEIAEAFCRKSRA